MRYLLHTGDHATGCAAPAHPSTAAAATAPLPATARRLCPIRHFLCRTSHPFNSHLPAERRPVSWRHPGRCPVSRRLTASAGGRRPISTRCPACGLAAERQHGGGDSAPGTEYCLL
jgi:hypothetical protein